MNVVFRTTLVHILLIFVFLVGIVKSVPVKGPGSPRVQAGHLVLEEGGGGRGGHDDDNSEHGNHEHATFFSSPLPSATSTSIFTSPIAFSSPIPSVSGTSIFTSSSSLATETSVPSTVATQPSVPSSAISTLTSASSIGASISVASVSVSAETSRESTSSILVSASISAASSVSADTAITTNAATNTVIVPGEKVQVLPIGLGVLGGVIFIALAVVAFVTYERRLDRKEFRLKLSRQSVFYGGEKPRSWKATALYLLRIQR
ncbi:hypothetical protein C8J56DRAFT_1162277 [Mycena floridula]|nr:hypothetical protein C8J56DRAFT_1162277 [Mycena floridula]